ncbi:Ctr copper transporter [Hygrophoropsis aurantiaca]|uniref:Ctr copper transporter n=1 Tax=Hygrophoropsis aurantiaca TaxID=72124 RepID=A0ACB8ADD0_9AGAM|nr:Ctr copper transporter [Hygrophoropsis aurantiaca]
MDMGSGNNGTDMSMMMTNMIPWLHFSGGDYLIFKAWKPSSHGAIAGACIALFAFSVLERWISAWRRTKEQALGLILEKESGASASARNANVDEKTNGPSSAIETIEEARPSRASTVRVLTNLRAVPPFIPSHDIPRGIYQGVQSFFSYALMLAVMTFQAAYIISIILGLAAGEILFGRIGRAQLTL